MVCTITADFICVYVNVCFYNTSEKFDRILLGGIEEGEEVDC